MNFALYKSNHIFNIFRDLTMNIKSIFSALAVTTALSVANYASAGTCATSDVYVTGVSNVTQGTTLLSNGHINATDCAGAFSGNDTSPLGNNLGYFQEGLLNGGTTNKGITPFPTGAFIDPGQMQDLDGDGNINDPGWIMIGKYEDGGFQPEAIGGDNTIITSDFFSVTANGDGTGVWSLTPDAGVIDRAESVLGKNLLDEFVLVIKSGNAFAVYDFSAEDLGLDPAILEVFNFTGEYDTTGTLINKGGKPAAMSHISVWIRDPENSSSVPEPNTLVLIALAALGLVRLRKKA